MAGPHTRSHRTPALACAALAACAALTACGDDGSGTAGPSPSSPGASSPAKDSPAGERLVLRRRQTGGIAGLGGPGSVPEFSLYSTGRAVVSSQGRLTEYRLKPDALRRLLDEARAAGLGRSHTVGSDRIADAIITVVGMGGATTRIIQPESQAGPEARFLKRLDPAGWPAADQAAEPRPYAPERTAVLAGPTTGGGTVKTWPLDPLGKGAQVAGAICTLAPPKRIPATGPDIAWRSEGETYSVRLRPLLPGESSCRDLA
ncbi:MULTISPECIES: hypothetical protein [Actinomadura]|uniref:Lipoprotein n=1 Tax=Actinomadura madurae TaxID=1993 RepID=A0A1I5IYG2_9ACTN|nr:hypothetical protein [Actinomadura madurae]SFO65624.1 hypothetical protein SAMN04489713_108173 [Actinomadura madurae]SPT58522.1 Uncharacterised protein [Actinomadura madurae]